MPPINPLKAEINPIYHLPALLGSHHILHVSGVRVILQKFYSRFPLTLVQICLGDNIHIS